MPAWPATLPAAPLASGFSEMLADNLLRSEMEMGPAKTRRRTSAGVRTLEAQYILSAAQTAILRGFFENDVKAGALAFDYTHPVTSVTVAARFAAPPVFAALNGRYYKVSVKIEVLP